MYYRIPRIHDSERYVVHIGGETTLVNDDH